MNKINVTTRGTLTRKDQKTKKIIKELKMVHELSAHVFRHNYATMLYYAGVPMKDTQYLLGHSNVKITLDIYTHLDKQKNNITEKLNSISAI